MDGKWQSTQLLKGSPGRGGLGHGGRAGEGSGGGNLESQTLEEMNRLKRGGRVGRKVDKFLPFQGLGLP